VEELPDGQVVGFIEPDQTVCRNPWCGLDFSVSSPEEAFERGRTSDSFFWHFFLLRCPHPGQLHFLENANATTNLLACSNRYGKTTMLAGRHFRKNVYKLGAEQRYLSDDYEFNLDSFLRTRYRTVHTAGEWDQAAEVWEDAQKLINESARLASFVKNVKKSPPYEIEFIHGAKWLFRTLGVRGSGIDGKSFYHLSIDEGGWIVDLESMLHNVLTIRVADVRGQIDIVGTFKPGMAKDFFKLCVRASAKTGVGIGFDHRSDETETTEDQGYDLDAAIWAYAKQFGFDLEAEMVKARELGTVE
jgi:hypothetical protein